MSSAYICSEHFDDLFVIVTIYYISSFNSSYFKVQVWKHYSDACFLSSLESQLTCSVKRPTYITIWIRVNVWEHSDRQSNKMIDLITSMLNVRRSPGVIRNVTLTQIPIIPLSNSANQSKTQSMQTKMHLVTKIPSTNITEFQAVFHLLISEWIGIIG